uniref:G-protein coupled receptors family 1 profile domain-containing protein n=1 Tax=Jaculus jaculus TaxID=51337 RepID=A0A8C5L238_JACJA
MDRENCSSVDEFIILGITNNREMKVHFFIVLVLVYLMTLMASVGMITLIHMDSQLHTPPMYFFLTEEKSIPIAGCGLQFLIFCVFKDSECVLLAVVAFDRYQAISNPLLYTVNMSSRVYTTLTFWLCFCGSNEIDHFFCDIPPLLLISCSDTQVNELAICTIFGFIELSTISGVLVSYCFIISSVFKIRCAEGGSRFGAVLFIYFKLNSSYSPVQDKMTSLFYILVIPMLNPLIDIKETLRKL